MLSLAAIQSILTQIAAALDRAHASGVVHGALSTRCILITLEGDAILADAALASARQSAAGHIAVDNPSTLAYASPEIVRGERATPLADQYSLGAVAYELLAGRRPFDGPPAKVKRAQLGKRPAAIGKLHLVHPDEWSDAVMKMLEKRPSDRFASLAVAVATITPPNGANDQSFRGTLGWLAHQQIPGAPPMRPITPVRPARPVTPVASVPALAAVAAATPLAPVTPVAPVTRSEPFAAPIARRRAAAAPVARSMPPVMRPPPRCCRRRSWAHCAELMRRPAHLFADARMARRRHLLTAAACVAAIALVGALWSGHLPGLTSTEVSNMLARVEQRLPTDPSPEQIAKAVSPATFATQNTSRQSALPIESREPPRAAARERARDVPREDPGATTRRDTRSVAASAISQAVRPSVSIVSLDSITLPTEERQIQPPEKPPAVVAIAPAGAAPSTARAPEIHLGHDGSIAHACAGRRRRAALVDQLRRGDFRSVHLIYDDCIARRRGFHRMAARTLRGVRRGSGGDRPRCSTSGRKHAGELRGPHRLDTRVGCASHPHRVHDRIGAALTVRRETRELGARGTVRTIAERGRAIRSRCSAPP